MRLEVRYYDVDSSEPTVLLHDDDCVEIGVQENDRVSVSGPRSAIVLVSRSDTLVEKGVVMVPASVMAKCGIAEGDTVSVTYSQKPDSVRSIRRKMDREKLEKEEIEAIVEDILENRLSKIEISAWLTALQINGMDIEEIAHFTKAMANTGTIIKFDREPVFDFHSLGGIPGNKITPIVVSIVAAAGIMIPKLSSRAISSACGTSDFVETFCDVLIDADRLKRVSEEIGGVFAWGGGMNLAPVDDMVINIEHPLGINPRAQMLASIMSKKVAVGATHLLVDIPTGSGTKVPTLEVARNYARDLMDLGEKLDMHVECAITYADQPVGNAVGPVLEARECISILEGSKHPASVVEKACECAGIILDMAGIPEGAVRAREILESGAAYEKFMQIVVAQGGRPDLKSSDLVPGKYSFDLVSMKSGYIHAIHNKDIVAIAKAAGAPNDKGAGLIIHLKKGQRVEAGEKLLTIYAESEAKLKRARETAMKYHPMDVEGMLIKRVSSSPRGI
ncbi:MAG: AMP phosphorylase [Candidatus Methanomethylophilaceae archaeon]|nr:AMP phosphorylase [Candidatus Methanomethylophilaceae archaeon]